MPVEEAARRLGVSRRSLEREMAAGNFPSPLKIRGRSVVLESDLQAYIEKKKRERGGPP